MPRKKKTKVDDVLRYLQEHEQGITPLVAQKRFHLYRLADAIHKLRKRGYEIETFKVEGYDAYGKNEYARYVLIGEGADE